ncbi:hypothetical protein HELRODRAFT_145029, partial [Helobdella robusta]|uniref:FYVE-type domain-containing protein n=1 Tax=Helobdella robusta TaxID=6412 RepID=T1EJI1_HELRO
AARQEARSKFKDSTDLVHRLFVCISGVADQLQTNYASDLRHILKVVFESYSSSSLDDNISTAAATTTTTSTSSNTTTSINNTANTNGSLRISQEPPAWLPDDSSSQCMSCKVLFTFVRRRHHCRNCGKIFCSNCSSNSVPLPHFGHQKPVRVCNSCFLFHVNPF